MKGIIHSSFYSALNFIVDKTFICYETENRRLRRNKKKKNIEHSKTDIIKTSMPLQSTCFTLPLPRIQYIFEVLETLISIDLFHLPTLMHNSFIH